MNVKKYRCIRRKFQCGMSFMPEESLNRWQCLIVNGVHYRAMLNNYFFPIAVANWSNSGSNRTVLRAILPMKSSLCWKVSDNVNSRINWIIHIRRLTRRQHPPFLSQIDIDDKTRCLYVKDKNREEWLSLKGKATLREKAGTHPCKLLDLAPSDFHPFHYLSSEEFLLITTSCFKIALANSSLPNYHISSEVGVRGEYTLD